MAKLHHRSPVQRRQLRVRAKLHGSAVRPRVSVRRSNQHIWAQAIDDDACTTLAAVSSRQVSTAKDTKSLQAQAVGQKIAELLKSQKISAAIFDRGQYRYHGRVKAVAEGLRSGGITV